MPPSAARGAVLTHEPRREPHRGRLIGALPVQLRISGQDPPAAVVGPGRAAHLSPGGSRRAPDDARRAKPSVALVLGLRERPTREPRVSRPRFTDDGRDGRRSRDRSANRRDDDWFYSRTDDFLWIATGLPVRLPVAMPDADLSVAVAAALSESVVGIPRPERLDGLMAAALKQPVSDRSEPTTRALARWLSRSPTTDRSTWSDMASRTGVRSP